MDELAKNLGQKIKFYRKQKNYSQSILSEKIGIESKYLSHIETGLSTPSLKTLEKIVDILGVDIGKFFEFEKEISREDLIKELNEKIINYSDNQILELLRYTEVVDKLNKI